MNEEEKYHREATYKWVVISDSQDEDDDYGTHYVCKGDGFKFFIVASANTYEEAEEMAIAMNYWETRPTTMDETPH